MTSKMIEELQAQVAELQAENARLQEHRERQELTAELKKGNVKPILVDSAINHLRATGAIKRDASGAIVLEQPDQYGFVERVPLDEGLSRWLRTPTGREFVEQPKRGEYRPMTLREISEALADSSDDGCG